MSRANFPRCRPPPRQVPAWSATAGERLTGDERRCPERGATAARLGASRLPGKGATFTSILEIGRRRGLIPNKTTISDSEAGGFAEYYAQEYHLSCDRLWGSSAEIMQTSAEMPRSSLPALHALRTEDMIDVANELLRSYLVLIQRGHHQRAIAEAMLGATVNLFDVLELGDELPVVLRALAERLECDRPLS